MTEFHPDRPTKWCPGQVRNPDGVLDSYFTDISAWEFVAAMLENGHPVEVMRLDKPPGAKGYVVSARTSFTEISATTSLTRRCHSRLTQSMAYTEIF